jgi:hypothetical protein
MFYAILIGTTATAFLDIWSATRTWLSKAPFPDYGLVGRWLAYLSKGKFFHEAIAKSRPIKGERLIGWTAHYLIGIAFATILLAIWGMDWVRDPTLTPALIVGIGSVAAPFFLMQPGMGAGIAPSRTPHPGTARLRSLTTHTIFGVGLYVAGRVVSLIDL